MSDDRERITVPDELDERIQRYFGSSSPRASGTYTAALWYAAERYEAEHDIQPPDPAHDEVDKDE